jgi:hypothetical protein
METLIKKQMYVKFLIDIKDGIVLPLKASSFKYFKGKTSLHSFCKFPPPKELNNGTSTVVCTVPT